MVKIGYLFRRPTWSANGIKKASIAEVYSGFGRMKFMNLCRSCWANYEEKKGSDGEMMRHPERPTHRSGRLGSVATTFNETGLLLDKASWQ
jgi:hypothetical protein